MKLFLSLLMAFSLCLGISACGSADTTPAESEESASAEKGKEAEASYIDWSKIKLGDEIPDPPSSVGVIEWNESYGFYVDVNDVDEGDFDRYVQKCRDAGYIINFATRENYYSAYKEGGYKLILTLEDGDILTINLMAPTKSTEKADANTNTQEVESSGSTSSTNQSTTTNDGPYKVTIESASKSTDFNGAPIAIVNFKFTNDSDETTSFLSACYPQVFQDGVECQLGFSMDIDASGAVSDIRPGSSIDVVEAYQIKSDSPIEVEVNRFTNSGMETIASKTLTLQ